jgi:pimeloyl-ACP methyl ester carboxylesterase
MLARAFRLAQLAELLLCAAAGAWLAARHGWSPGAVALAVFAWIGGVRLGSVCVSMLAGWILASPRAGDERIGPAATVRMVLGEWRALLAFNLVNLPWERWVLRPDPAAAPTDRVPVILVHGFLANRGYFRPLVRRLEALGIGPVFAPTFPVWRVPIADFEAELHRQVERIVVGTRQPRVVLVAHSMGGLACRAYLARRGAGRVARLVTLATPHRGTQLARLGLGANAREMEPGSAFLVALEAAEAGSPPVPTLSIYSPHDNIVVPQATSRLPGARNVALPGLGHIAIGGSPRTVERLLPELEAAGARRG